MVDYTIIKKPEVLETFICIGKVKNDLLMESLKKDIDEELKKSNMNYQTNVYGKMTNFNALNNNKNFHEFCSLAQNIFLAVTNNNGYICRDAWGNIYEKNDFAHEHDHRDCSAFSGVLYLDDVGPGTYFPKYDMTVKEEPGKFVLFHPYVKHSVHKFIYGKKKRYTIAFNFNDYKKWDKV
jgi:hypothetical protein